MEKMTLREAHKLAVALQQPLKVTIREGERVMTTRVSMYAGEPKVEQSLPGNPWVTPPESHWDDMVEVER